MVTSTGMSNVVWVLLVANWFLEGWSRPNGSNWSSGWREKWQMAKESRLLQAILVLALLYVIKTLTDTPSDLVLKVLRTKIPLLLVPLVILTTPPPEKRARSIILWVYVTTVTIVTLMAVVRMITHPELPYRDLLPFMIHLRYALHCSAAFFICLLEPPRGRWRYAAYGLALWMVAFLVLVHSVTGFVMLAVASLVVILCRKRNRKWVIAWLAAAGIVAAFCLVNIHSYYHLCPLAQEPLRAVTANGRPYTHQDDGFIECGNYVHNYICFDELYSQWSQRSSVSLDSVTPSGYTLTPVLIRYLNALGLTKDSAGVAALTDSQVADIEQGYANPVYAHGLLPKQIIYKLLFEYENYRHYDVSEGFTMLQRIELWQAAWRVANRHPWLGNGFYHINEDLNDELHAMQSPLSDGDFHVHSQYLLWLIAFGRIGFVVILLAFLRASSALRRQPPLLLVVTVIILISFLTETPLGLLAECLFCVWFFAFRSGKNPSSADHPSAN